MLLLWNTIFFLSGPTTSLVTILDFLRIVLFTLHPIHLLFVHKLYFYINLGFNSLLSKVTQRKLTAMSYL